MIPPTFISGEKAWEIKILNQIQEIIKCGFEKPIVYKLNIQINLLSIFHTMIKENAFVKATVDSKNNNLRIKSALTVIHQNYSQGLQVSDIASSLNICTEHFIRSFKSIVGKTPNEYITAYRISRAASMLVKHDEAIAEIAVKCGFDDVNYFSRRFKKVMGVSPTEYREGDFKIE